LAEAQLMLASTYANVPELRDPAESAKWYMAAAVQGLPIAQGSIGHCYASGRGVEKDLEKARFWLQLAADQGQWLGAGTLGDLYRGDRRGEPGDYVQAYRWYTVGARVLAEAGRKDILESMFARRSQIAERMRMEQIAEAEALAAQWVRRDWSELESRLEQWK
jgi:TPR repeat protein